MPRVLFEKRRLIPHVFLMSSEWVGTGTGARQTWVQIQHTRSEASGSFLNLSELQFSPQPPHGVDGRITGEGEVPVL